ncbi:hypothetical protein [Haladaptatus caseinilyticus]|uniref:hypothetical protein n=1 Tax=Haladaptatus caseinilyticus TaxID=2993314 RepID=UPI00224AA6E1|nr:hypothetical protein [Haladaptatus caseinilyticus]
MSLKLARADPTRFECKSCGTRYELDRQACVECGGYCLGYRDSWLNQLDDRTPRQGIY